MAYQIKVTPNYYGNHIPAQQPYMISYANLHDIVREIPDYEGENYNQYDDQIAEFETEEDAQNMIDMIQGDGPYYLSHGEAGRPTYDIINDDEINEDDCEDATRVLADDYIYDYKMVDADDLPDGIQDILDGLNVDYRDSHDDFDVYIDYYTDDETDNKYAIAYCPTSIAIQKNSDDLGGVNWDKQAYFAHIDNG